MLTNALVLGGEGNFNTKVLFSSTIKHIIREYFFFFRLGVFLIAENVQITSSCAKIWVPLFLMHMQIGFNFCQNFQDHFLIIFF